MVEWIKKSIGDLFSISGGRSASRAQLSENGHFYLHYGDIHASTKTYIDTNEDKAVIPRLDVPLNKVSADSLLQDGDVVFVDASEDDIGASRHIVVRNTDEVPFIAGLHTIVAKPLTDETEKTYREYCFQTDDVIRQFKHYAVGTKVTGVGKTTIKKIFIQFPKSLPTQRAIADALSDTDRYITSLKRLIAKKRDIKLGSMHELLRSKEGFFSVELGKHCDIFRGGSPRPIQNYLTTSDSGVNWIKIGDVSVDAKYINSTAERITPGGALHSRAVQKGDLVLSNSMSFGRPYILNIDGCIHDGWLVIQNYQDDFELSYLYYVLGSEETMKQYKSMAAGSSVQNLNKEKVNSLIVFIPSKGEQIHIAAILSDMDTEIDALTAKLNKAKLIKQGMMEQLLTGKMGLEAESNA